MSVIIKNMEKPSMCLACPFLIHNWREAMVYCTAGKKPRKGITDDGTWALLVCPLEEEEDEDDGK